VTINIRLAFVESHANRYSGFLVMLLTKKQRKKQRKKSITNNTPSPYGGQGKNAETQNAIRYVE